jgi:CBS domain-containing protein
MAPRAAARLETLGFTSVFHYRGGKLDWMASGHPTEGENSKHPRAADVARKDVTTCRLEERLGDVRERAAAAGLDAAVVIDGQRVVLGLMRAAELAKDPDLTIEKAMRPGPSTFRPYVPIKEVADHMDKRNLDSSPITTSDGRLVGLLLHSDARRQAEGCPDCARQMI